MPERRTNELFEMFQFFLENKPTALRSFLRKACGQTERQQVLRFK